MLSDWSGEVITHIKVSVSPTCGHWKTVLGKDGIRCDLSFCCHLQIFPSLLHKEPAAFQLQRNAAP